MRQDVESARLAAGECFLQLGWRRTSRMTDPREWIKVHGHVRAPEGEWRFRDGCFEVQEAREWAAWLEVIARGGEAEATIKFLEPCLSFEYFRQSGQKVVLRTRFRGEVSPPWLWGDSEAVWEQGYWLELEVPCAEFERFAGEIRGLLSR
jgi:hypothetical protein